MLSDSGFIDRLSRAEICRYLGFHGNAPDEGTVALIEDCILELKAVVSPKYYYREYTLSERDGVSDFGFMTVSSKSLAKCLGGCGSAIVFAATLGMELDRLLSRYSRLQLSRAVVLQAVSAAALERCCDELCGRLSAEYGAKGLYLRPRFSPGYGDFSLEHQRDIFSSLELSKRIGVTLTDSLLMLPGKSVTAIIGISAMDMRCCAAGCELCGNKDCAYRRG